MWYRFLNIFFFVFHTIFTLFNIVGWIFPKTRKLHLITISLTAFSWFILGNWYGWGYCFCTDWHWMVREKLGYKDHSRSLNSQMLHSLSDSEKLRTLQFIILKRITEQIFKKSTRAI